MKKINLFIFMLFAVTISKANGFLATIEADHAYVDGNASALKSISRNNPDNKIAEYMFAKLMLSRDNTEYAETFIHNSPNSFLKNDLIHQLLEYYQHHNEFNRYLSAYALLYNTQISLNEKCGHDLANLALGKMDSSLTDSSWLVNNPVPLWCANLVAKEYANGHLNSSEYRRLRYNLMTSDETASFEGIIPKIDARKHKNKWLHRHSSPNTSVFATIRRISKVAYKNPELALETLKNQYLDKDAHDFLINYIAMQFARKQDFNRAINLFNEHPTSFLSDNEFEWKARSYLYYSNWEKLIHVINQMPDTLKNQPVWLYWEATAYHNIGKKDEAHYLFSKIPADYSYYALLTRVGEPSGNSFILQAPKSADATNTLSTEVEKDFTLYRFARQYKRRNLEKIATYQWYYLARKSTDAELIAMSEMAQRQDYYLLSIYAANQLEPRYLNLSFPTPFLEYYNEYSREHDIPTSYPLAISRQESRFNYNAIAFDGGIGLMQLMPQTSRYIFHKSHTNVCNVISLECNIKLGTWYLGNLYHKFGSYIYASAAYNAGPNRPIRWQDKVGQLDNRIQIELIPIASTREYVEKVLTNKAIYDSIFNHSNKIDLLNYIVSLDNGTKRDSSLLNDDNTDAGKL